MNNKEKCVKIVYFFFLKKNFLEQYFKFVSPYDDHSDDSLMMITRNHHKFRYVDFRQ